MIMNFELTQGGESLIEKYNQWWTWADAKVFCDYELKVGVNWWSDKVAVKMESVNLLKWVANRWNNLIWSEDKLLSLLLNNNAIQEMGILVLW